MLGHAAPFEDLVVAFPMEADSRVSVSIQHVPLAFDICQMLGDLLHLPQPLQA